MRVRYSKVFSEIYMALYTATCHLTLTAFYYFLWQIWPVHYWYGAQQYTRWLTFHIYFVFMAVIPVIFAHPSQLKLSQPNLQVHGLDILIKDQSVKIKWFISDYPIFYHWCGTEYTFKFWFLLSLSRNRHQIFREG